MGATIRAAALDDWPSIAQLLDGCALPLDGARDHLGHFSIAVDDNNEVVGSAGLEIHGTVGLLRSVAVVSQHRGTGIASALTEAILARAKSTNLSAVYLLTTTAADYFARRGFVTIARGEAPDELLGSEEFRGACPSTATLQVLRLGPMA